MKVGTHYRLYAALCVNERVSYGLWTTNKSRTCVVYSDDFGKSWNTLGTQPVVADGNEAKCEELPNGNVVVSSRATGTRIFNIFKYDSQPTAESPAAGSWLGAVASDTKTDGIDFAVDNATNGEIIIVPASKTDGTVAYYALQSVSDGHEDGRDGRGCVSVYYKELSESDYTNVGNFASGWTKYPVSTNPGAYSTMVLQDDGNIGVLYEDDYYACGEGDNAEGYSIKYKSIPLTTIINYNKTENLASDILTKKLSKIDCCGEFRGEPDATYSWASLYLPFSVSLPEGVTAYKVVSLTDDNATVNLEPISSGQFVSYETPVILRDSQKRTEINLVYEGYEVGDAEAGNLMEGTATEMSGITREDYFVLGHGDNHIGFYHPSAYTLKPNLAYLSLVGSNVRSLSFSFGGATGVDGVEANEEIGDGFFYDLSGRRVDNPARGIYIKNGKKYFVK